MANHKMWKARAIAMAEKERKEKEQVKKAEEYRVASLVKLIKKDKETKQLLNEAVQDDPALAEKLHFASKKTQDD